MSLEPSRTMEQTLNPASRFWDGIAEEYSRKPIADPDAYQRKLEATKARLRPDDVMLDIGCGTGSLALELAPLVAHVHAIDLSGEMIRIAERKAEAAGVDNVTFYTTTIEDEASLPRESFDVVTAYNLLHLVDDLDATLRKIFAQLKPGGSFISSTVCLRESWVPFGLILPVMHLVGKAPRVRRLGVRKLEDAMRAAGFVDVTATTVTDKKTTAFELARKPA